MSFLIQSKKRRGGKKREKAQINENGPSTPTAHTLRDQILIVTLQKIAATGKGNAHQN